MRPTNTVIILSDEHNRDIAGCYGDSVAQTPNLDEFARVRKVIPTLQPGHYGSQGEDQAIDERTFACREPMVQHNGRATKNQDGKQS